MNIQFPQVEGMQIIHDHQEVPEESEMWIAAGLILLVMEMLLIKMKMAMAMDIASKLTYLYLTVNINSHNMFETGIVFFALFYYDEVIATLVQAKDRILGPLWDYGFHSIC